ncbi:hypothetical protein FRC08_006769 [Ceratobasidium sp. 394]|nr:hypothetical protein FRC08_006769 [Ceratobasidium sp. 394]
MNRPQDLGDTPTSVREFGLPLCPDRVDISPLPVHNHNSNLNPDGTPNYEDLPAPYFGYQVQPTPIDNPSYGPFPEDILAVDNTSLGRFFIVTGNTYRILANGTIQLYQELSPPALIPVSPNPVKPDSAFHVGVLPFYIDELGQLYSVKEEQNTLRLEPKPVFNTEGEALVSLGTGGGQIPTPGHNLPVGTLPPTPFDSILDPNFDRIFDASIQGFAAPLSPATSRPYTPVPSTAQPNTLGECPPPLSGPGSEILTHGFGHPDCLSPPTTTPPLPPSSPGEIEVDEHVTSLKAQRRHRGVRPSPIALQCPKCERICRRPHVLSEHMKSVHLELRTFKCPRAGCSKDFTTSSNRTRHLKKCSFPVE